MEGHGSNMLALEAEQQELENPTYTEAPASWLTPHINPFTHSEDSYGLSGSAVDVGLQGPGSPALEQRGVRSITPWPASEEEDSGTPKTFALPLGAPDAHS